MVQFHNKSEETLKLEKEREERLQKALRDNLRRRKAPEKKEQE
jgi:hypothetical protein